jgi:hypothetical protein
MSCYRTAQDDDEPGPVPQDSRIEDGSIGLLVSQAKVGESLEDHHRHGPVRSISAAKAVKISQAELSRAEAREDHRLSTLRRYVEALGGEVEVIARFGDTSIRVKSV